MTNTNCLEGIQCPVCGNEATFRIEVTTLATVTDDGTEFDGHGGVDWDENSHAECVNCLTHGKLSGFKTVAAAPTPGPWSCNESGMVRGQGPGDADGPPFVCDVTIDCSMGLTPRERANGRLITAAPDLLAALEHAVAALNAAPRFRVPSLDTDSYNIASICDRAIAKAKGAAQ